MEISNRLLMDENMVDAEPTKDLFIYMLTRDVGLDKAIIDLVDNSVDAAKTIKGSNGPFDGCKITIEVHKNYFLIQDNCGGFDIKTAKEYAFKFGRISKERVNICETGNFGIGMKRTLFKLGNCFIVQSKCKNEEFVVYSDIEEWKKTSEWKFKIDTNITSDCSLEEDGVFVYISNIHKDNKNVITDDFIRKLIEDIEKSLGRALSKGLEVSVNGSRLNSIEFYFSEENYFKPLEIDKTVTVDGSEIRMQIYAGLANRDKWESGWYIFCNDRLIIAADQTSLTGWSDGLPNFHTNFASFRGYAFLSSCDGNVLPWTTNKSGINTSSAAYLILKKKIVEITKPICIFLNTLATEVSVYNASPEDFPKDEPYIRILERAPLKRIEDITFNSRIELPEVEIITTRGRDENKFSSIQYHVLKERIKRVKNCLSVASNKEVGLKTFEYYYKMECGDD